MAGAQGQEVRGVIAFIGIGSNLGDPVAACLEAVKRVAEVPGIQMIRRSSLYRTEPVGHKDQAWFVNLVGEIRTDLAPRQLLMELKGIEAKMGRTAGTRWGPRVIDLDVLLYDQWLIQEDDLVIPHPELHRRAFVLVPLAEIASYVIHPAFGVSIRGLKSRLKDRAQVTLYDGPGTTVE